MKDISSINLKSLKKQLSKKGYHFKNKISSGGYATTITVKKGFCGKKRCAKIFVDGNPTEIQAEFNTMKKLFAQRPTSSPNRLICLKLLSALQLMTMSITGCLFWLWNCLSLCTFHQIQAQTSG